MPSISVAIDSLIEDFKSGSFPRAGSLLAVFLGQVVTVWLIWAYRELVLTD